MEIDAGSPPSQSYTILRIKRKRNEEPLDALVVESRRKKKSRGGGIGVFQFAQTVEPETWKDETSQRDLEEQITRLARERATAAQDPQSLSTAPNPNPNPRASPTVAKDELFRRYTVIQQEAEGARKRRATSPPRVISAKDLPPKPRNGFKLYDAVLSSDSPRAGTSDEDMDAFNSLLEDYLKVNDIAPSPTVDIIPPTSSEDYVWDVFYHRPATLSEWNDAANVGTLTGLPPSITDPYDSDSDEEEEDDADEDSNAEEYYKNDYPDEEDSVSDDGNVDDREFYEDSEEEVEYDDGSDHDWR